MNNSQVEIKSTVQICINLSRVPRHEIFITGPLIILQTGGNFLDEKHKTKSGLMNKQTN